MADIDPSAGICGLGLWFSLRQLYQVCDEGNISKKYQDFFKNMFLKSASTELTV